MKDIDPNLRRKASLKNGVAVRTGYDAFVLALEDLIETRPLENPDDPERGTYIQEYLKDSVNMFNSLIIEDQVKSVVENYLDDYDVDVASIEVRIDYSNNEYVVVIPVRESDISEDNRDLEIVLEIKR